jgi:hypothetical protein
MLSPLFENYKKALWNTPKEDAAMALFHNSERNVLRLNKT